jgi:predicted RNase H-like HicB family nuclease
MEIRPNKMKFTIIIEKNEEGSYTVIVPSLPRCITQGDT